jgi:hypothetical protein
MMLILLCAVLAVEVGYRPRLDWTLDKKLLLWYGIEQRNFYIIYPYL